MILRRVVWLAYLVLWTAVLVTPQPVHVSQATLPGPARFSVAKSLHIAAYALLCILSAWQRLPMRWRPLLLLSLATHAALTEYIQQYVPERSGTLSDVLLNLLGLYLGVVLAWRWWRE